MTIMDIKDLDTYNDFCNQHEDGCKGCVLGGNKQIKVCISEASLAQIKSYQRKEKLKRLLDK